MKNFKSLYLAAEDFSLAGKSIEEMYDALSIEDKMVLMKSRVDEVLTARIISALTPSDDDYITRQELNTLKSAFFYSVKLDGKSDDWTYYVTLNELTSIIGSKLRRFKPLSNVTAWKEAVMYLKCYIGINKVPDEYTLCIGMESEIHRIKAINRLKKVGVKCQIGEDNKLKITGCARCLSELSFKMESVGGVRFTNQILSMMEYNEPKGRYIFIPNCHPDPLKTKPTVPVGYLLNLAFCKTSSKGSEKAKEKYFDDIIQLATDLCVALYPVNSYFAWDDITYDSPTEYMQKWVIYDDILSLQQMSQDFCSDMMNYLIGKIESDGRSFNRTFTLAEFKSLMQEIFSLTKENKFVQIKRSQLSSVQDKAHLSAIINDIASSCVNPNFVDPLDYGRINWSDKPAIGLPNGDLLLYPSCFGAYGWYELMMTLLREQDKIVLSEIEEQAKKTGYRKKKFISIDNFVGYALEDYVKTKLQGKGILAKCGKYKADGIDGECDVVVEGSGKICLMELKKKNLTRSARMGYLYQILLDFAGSVLYSQEQAFRTEALLKRKGRLDLDDNGVTKHLDYKGQICEKVTITLNEYGPLHERIIQKNILDALYRYKYEVNSDEIKTMIPDITKANETILNYIRLEKKRSELALYITELANYKRMGSYDPFFDSWFFSIEQLCYLIDKSTDADDFIDKFSKLKHISMSTKNFWAEVDYKLNLR